LFGASTKAGRPSAGDDVGHRVGLAGARHSKQGLEGQAVLHALDQQADRLGLVAGRRKRLVQPVRAARELTTSARNIGAAGNLGAFLMVRGKT
jgi:hypothetical protein